MGNRNYLFHVVAIISASFFPLGAQDAGDKDLVRITEVAFQNIESETDLFVIIDEGIARAGKLEQGKAGVLQAELYLLRARILLQQNRNSEADKYLALAEAQAANTTENDSADAIALLVEIRTAMFTTRGLGYIISNGGTIEMLLKKAIEKDPDNIRAIILQANSELYKPFGSLDSSITLFGRALKLSGITKQQRFVALLGLAEAWNKKWNADKRKEYLKTAKEYYPNNPILKKALKEAGL